MTPHGLVSLEVRLDWLISQTGMVKSLADRRLNAIENLLAMLSRQWRGSEPVDVARELRLSPLTLGELHTWLSERGKPDARTTKRLSLYSASLDDMVPEGWLRVIIK